jgi:hypothetical protein
MKTTKEILDILDREISTDYNDTEYHQVTIEIGLLSAAFVHGYRVAEKEHCAKVKEYEKDGQQIY